MIELLRCPNCGAPIKPWKQTKCEYCDSYFKTDEPLYVHQAILYADDQVCETYNLDEQYYKGYNLFQSANDMRKNLLTKLGKLELEYAQAEQTNQICSGLSSHIQGLY